MSSGLIQANAAGDLIEEMGWQRVALLYTPDNMASSVAAAFRNRAATAKKAGFQITKEIYFAQDGFANTDWNKIAEEMARLPNNIFFISAQMDQIDMLFRALRSRNMFTRDRIYITTPMLGLGLYVNSFNASWVKNNMRNVWSINAQEYYKSPNGSLTPGGTSFQTRLIQNFKTQKNMTLAAAPPYTAFGYDCTMQLLLGYHRLLQAGGTNVTLENLADQKLGSLLKPSTFANVTGTDALKFATTTSNQLEMHANGDRIARYEFAYISSTPGWKIVSTSAVTNRHYP
jgi:hypothetical protein